MNLLEQLSIPFSQARVLTDSLTDAVMYTDRNFAIVYLNKAAERMFEVNSADVTGTTIDEVISYDVEEQDREAVLKHLSMYGYWQGYASLIRQGGRRMQLYINMALIRSEKRKAENILLVCASATAADEVFDLVGYLTKRNEELELARQQLVQVQHQFESFMQYSPALTWIVNAEGKFIFANDLYKKSMGITEINENTSIATIFPAPFCDEYLMNNRRVILANTAIENLEPCVLPSGERKLYKVFKFPINATSGDVWVGGIALDITEQVARQDQLQVSNERFRHVIKATSEAIWDWDIMADKVYRGEGFKRLFGTDLETKPMELRNPFVHIEDRDRVYQSLVNALNDDATHWQEEYRFLSLDGHYKICVDRASILRDRTGKPIRMIGAMQDVTRERELENELRRKELQRRQNISKAVIDAQEKERFEISFELHEQISQTLTTCKLLLEDLSCGDDQDRLEYCRKLLGQSINNIRNISHRINPGTLDVIGLSGALENLIHNIGKDDKLHIELVTSGLEKVELLPEGLQLAAYRVVQEQLNNILKHAKATSASILLQLNENRFLIEVADNGQGFDLRSSKRGLGLANIQHRAELHQGEMSIHSVPGEGTTLRLIFHFPPVQPTGQASLN